jgi:OOP family OmpA-OmpF porin
VADEESKNRIAKIAEKLSARAVQDCLVGLGEPSPRWAEAVEKALSISPRLLNAKVVFDNLNISVILDHSFPEKEHTEILNSISNNLPPEFVLSFIKLSNDGGSDLSFKRVVATLSPEGLLKIVGPIGEELDIELVSNFAKVRFGSENASISLYKEGSLPDDWGFRIIAGLEGLRELKNGILNVTPNLIEIRGKTYKKFSPAKISKVVGDKIGYDQRLSLSVDYIDMPKPADDSLTASQCVNKIEETLRVRKIKFEPGSDRVDLAGHETLDDIAKILLNCGDIRLEIGGHTDSQGREQMNLNLSQSRANSVLFELQRRRVLTKNIIAKGYGESQPIASNDTEQGREINRRIEFTPFDKSMGTTVAPKVDIRN